MATSKLPPYVTPRPQDPKTPYSNSDGAPIGAPRPAGPGGVPANYVVMYVQGVPLTVQDYVDTFGPNGYIRPDMGWDDYWNVAKSASQQMNRYLIENGLPSFKPDLSGIDMGDPDYNSISTPITTFYQSDGSTLAPSGGSGRGSGAAAIYQAPDRAAVEDYVKSYVVAVTGTVDPNILNNAVEAFLAADKKAFDLSGKGGSTVDPATAMKQSVRGTAPYKQIHQLRPESVDEMDWVTGRQSKLRQLGVSDMRAEQLGIRQATAGATDDALIQAGNAESLTQTGLMLRQQRESLKQSASAALSLVR